MPSGPPSRLLRYNTSKHASKHAERDKIVSVSFYANRVFVMKYTRVQMQSDPISIQFNKLPELYKIPFPLRSWA